MKVLKTLTAAPAIEEPGVITGTRAQLHHEVSAGVFVHISLTPSHLAITHSDQQFAVPIESLLSLVRSQSPGFAVVKPTVAK